MNLRCLGLPRITVTIAVFLASACEGSVGTMTGSGGAAAGTGGAQSGSGGGIAPGTGGNPTAGTGGAAAGSGGGSGSGGAVGSGGRPGTTGTGGRGPAGSGGTSASGGAGGAPPPLDCGPDATVIENHGPPANRINYVIIGDGYAAADLNTTLIDHVNFYMAKRFTELGQPYLRYRNFVNICVLKKASTPICGSSALGCCGDDASRLANCDNAAVNAAITAGIPASFMVDWKAVVLNGSSWWNSGGMLMYWSGGNRDADGAALHEGSHGFHQLADEYGSNNNNDSGCNTENREVNSTHDPATTGGKWDLWLGYNAVGATGMQVATQTGFSVGSRYCSTTQWRPSDNSMMNSLFGDAPNTSFNSVSREQMAIGMWRYVVPIDSTEPAAGAVTNPAMLKVNVIDAAVINVDWTVDGTTMMNGGTTLNTSTLAAGAHTITARAYDNATTDLVRYKTGVCPASVTGTFCHRTAWNRSTQTVTWTVTKN
jgi:hypothetical protein